VPGARLAPNSALDGVAVVSKRLAWAVGTEGFSSDGKRPGRPVIERWNGRSWSLDRLPSTWPGDLGLVAASSATDAWALGGAATGAPLRLLHWARLRWREVAFPRVSGTIHGNLDLTAATGGRAWIIADASGSRSSLIVGWNGTRWAQQAYSCPALFCTLISISGRTSSDAWAVGGAVTPSSSARPLALHWTGHAWHLTTMPSVNSGYISGVAAVSNTDAWAVGGVNNTRKALLFHWNGHTWRLVKTPAGLSVPPLGEVTGIAADTAGHLWIYDLGPQPGTTASYLRYDGHRWSLVQGPVIKGQSGVIVRQVATVPGTTTAWSVGLGFVPPRNARARIERYS